MSSSIPPIVRDGDRGVSSSERQKTTASINIQGHEFSINWTKLSTTKKIGAIALLVLSAPLIVPAVAGFSIGYYGRKGVETIISKIFKESQDAVSPHSSLVSLESPEAKAATEQQKAANEQQLALNEIADFLTKNDETSIPTNIAVELNKTIANNEQILIDMPRSRDIVVNGEVKKTGYNYENEVRELGILLGKDASEKSIQKLTAFFSQQLSGAEVAVTVSVASNAVPVRYAPATHFISYEKEGENINVNVIFAFNISHNYNPEGKGLIEPSLWAIANYSLPIEELKADKPFESIQQRIVFIPRKFSNENIEAGQKNLSNEEMLLDVNSPEGQAFKEDRSEQSRVMTSKVYNGFISDLEKAAQK